MIHPEVEIIDLYPLTWRNLGDLFRIDEWSSTRPSLDKKVLSILHDRGTILKIDAPSGVVISPDVIAAGISDPETLARQLYNAYPGLTRVQVFEQGALRNYSVRVQGLDWRHLTSGDFYLAAFQLAEADSSGLCYYPPENAPFALRQRVLKRAAAMVNKTPDGSVLVLGVFDEGQPYFTLIVQVRAGLITLCTTFEHLVNYGIDPQTTPTSESDSKRVIAAVEQAIGPVAQALFCERSVFETLLKMN